MDYIIPIVCFGLAGYIIVSAYKSDKVENKHRLLELCLGGVIFVLTLFGFLSRLF